MIISLRDKALSIIIVFLFGVVPLFGEGSTLHPVRRGEKYGYANEEGRMVISARFAIAMEFGEGLAYVAESPDRQGAWKHGFINENGKWAAFLDGKSFHPDMQTNGYRGRTDCVVFRNGFAELPSYNSTGGQDFETSSVWINRHQMMELLDRFGKETRIRPTSRIFFTKLLEDDKHILGVCAKARNTKGPNGITAFDKKSKKPVTTKQAGESNEWFGTFGVIRYTGNTYLVYKETDRQVMYFDEVTVVEDGKGTLEFLGKELGGPFKLYSTEIQEMGNDTFATVGDFMKSHIDYRVRETEDYVADLEEFQSRRMMNFGSMREMEEYYLTNGERFNTAKAPVCIEEKGDAKAKVRIETRCGTIMITDYQSAKKEAWLFDFTTNIKTRVTIPLEVDASGRNGEDGEDGSAGAAGRPKLTYKEGNLTKTEAGTCGEAGGDGENGENGENGATLLVIMDSQIPDGMVVINVDGGKGGKGGDGGVGGIHGNGSSCKGKAKDGKPGRNGKDGEKGEVKIVKFR